MSERRVFESLCVEPGSGGFSYDSALLVDVDRAVDFDEAVIRLTTKCSSIITQLSTLGHPVTEFSIACAKVGVASSVNRRKAALNGFTEDTCHHIPNNLASTPEGRNLKAMAEMWCGLKQKNYSGMVAVARLTRSSIPRNGCGSRYSVKTLKEALLSHIQAYFMFQAFNPMFQPWSIPGKDADDDTHAEYLIFLVYRIHSIPALPSTGGKRPSRRLSELEKLETSWSFTPTTPKRKRQLSSGSSVSSSSSSVSSGPSCNTMPMSRPLNQASFLITDGSVAAPPFPLFPENYNYGFDWSGWPVPERRGTLRSNVQSLPMLVGGSHMVLRHKKARNSEPQRK